MGIKKSTRPRMRRVATVVAAFGALTMSSGVALLATATSADAAPETKVNICHATGSDTNPYVFIQVNNDSVKLKGHLMHRESPNKTWKSAGTYEGVAHQAGDPKPDLIGSFTDDNGVFHEYDGDITADSCNGDVVTPLATADVDFTNPTCANDNTASYDPVGDHVAEFTIVGTVAPGEHVVVTAHAADDYTFEGGQTTEDFPWTFSAAEADCGGVVTPPTEVTPVAPQFTEPTCTSDPAVVLPQPAALKKTAGPVLETADVDGVHYVVTGSLEPGGTVDVDATAIDPAVLVEGATTHWEHTFVEVSDCSAVDVPTDSPTTDSPTTAPVTVVTTPTVVHAGLTGASAAKDLRSEQGLALLVAGMILMVIAGGLGLRPVRGATRS